MRTQNTTIELIAQVMDSPTVYREADKVPFLRCLLNVTQTKRGANDWEKVAQPYQRVILAYRKLVDLFETFQTGDTLHLRCKTVSKLQQDEQGMVFEANDWVAVAVKVLETKTAHRPINQTLAAKPKAQEYTPQVTPVT